MTEFLLDGLLVLAIIGAWRALRLIREPGQRIYVTDQEVQRRYTQPRLLERAGDRNSSVAPGSAAPRPGRPKSRGRRQHPLPAGVEGRACHHHARPPPSRHQREHLAGGFNSTAAPARSRFSRTSRRMRHGALNVGVFGAGG